MSTLDAVSLSGRHLPLRYRAAAKLVLAQLSRWRGRALTLSFPDRNVARFGDQGGEPPLHVTVRNWRFFWRALIGADIGLGESYMAGEWECSDLVALCREFLRNQSALPHRSPWTAMARLRHTLLRLTSANTLSGSRRNIQHHYDLSNELYRLFLDDSMMYSCAEFARADMSLAEAQRHKIDQICHRLDLRPGLTVLEIGSGWGEFAMHAARTYGCRVTSLTLSQQQLALARERVAAAGLSSLVDIRLCDYRQCTGTFDRIVSIEMLEAVGYEYYGAFFSQCHRLLAPDGRMFLQVITVPDQRFDSYRRDFDWIRKYIFPGGLLPSVHVISEALKRHTDLRIEWIRDIGPHYAPTLRHWRERFLSRWTDVRRLGFDERFRRMWEFYLASCEAAFATRWIGDAQMIVAR